MHELHELALLDTCFQNHPAGNEGANGGESSIKIFCTRVRRQ